MPAIPATLQDSLIARLDRVAAVKEVAQLGAAVGREFSHHLLAALSPLAPTELEEALPQLVSSGLLFRRGVTPDATYRFKHALVGDAAYVSLLRGKRKELHARIAEEMETWTAEASAEPEILAHHLTEAGLEGKAIAYWQKAGQRAVERYANAEAAAHFERGLALLRSLPDSVGRDRRELEMLTALGSILIGLKGAGAPAVATVHGRAQELCRSLGETRHLVPALQGLRLYHQERAELRTAQTMAGELLELGARVPEPRHLLEAHRAAGVVNFFAGGFRAAREHLEAGIGLLDATAEETDVLRSEHDAGVTCLAYAARTLWMLGYQDQARDHAEQAIVTAQAAAHTPSMLEAMIWRAEIAILRGKFRIAEQHAAPALATAMQQALPLWTGLAAAMLGRARYDRTQSPEDIGKIRGSLIQPDRTSDRLMLLHCRAILAEALATSGQVEEALAIVDEVIEDERSDRVGCWDSPLQRLKGELLLARDASIGRRRLLPSSARDRPAPVGQVVRAAGRDQPRPAAAGPGQAGRGP